MIIVSVNEFRNEALKRLLTHNRSSSAKTRFELEFRSLECANTLWNSDIVIDDLIHERQGEDAMGRKAVKPFEEGQLIVLPTITFRIHFTQDFNLKQNYLT